MKNNLQNSNVSIEKKIDWKLIQAAMRAKLGTDIFESWLKKIDLVEEYNNYILISALIKNIDLLFFDSSKYL